MRLGRNEYEEWMTLIDKYDELLAEMYDLETLYDELLAEILHRQYLTDDDREFFEQYIRE